MRECFETLAARVGRPVQSFWNFSATYPLGEQQSHTLVCLPRAKRRKDQLQGFLIFNFFPLKILNCSSFFFQVFSKEKQKKSFQKEKYIKLEIYFIFRISPFPNENLERKFFLIFFLELKIYKLQFLGKNDLKNF